MHPRERRKVGRSEGDTDGMASDGGGGSVGAEWSELASSSGYGVEPLEHKTQMESHSFFTSQEIHGLSLSSTRGGSPLAIGPSPWAG